jgi:VCBS repeat-containing protein
MADSIAVVASLEGQAWAKSSDGTLRPLKVGDSVSAEEVVVTATGARIELDFGDGKPVAIAGGQEVLMGNDLWVDLASDKQDAAVDDASVQEALRVLNEGGDLTEVLEETAAGLEGGGAGEGHSFVELTRVVENTSPNAFSFGAVNNGAERVPATFQSSNQINQAPQVDAQSFSSDEDTIINGQVIATDIENDVLSYSLLSQPANGTVTLNSATGSFVYTPNANYNGPDSFLVTVTDDNGNSTTATIGVTIAPVNDAPVSSNQNLSTQEDTSVSGQVIASDIEGDTLTYSITSNATNGTVTLNAATGTFVYTPNPNYNGSDSFVVTINDGNGGTTTSLITIGVTPVNDAPISNNQSLVTDEDVAINGQVIASDVDGDTLNYSVSGQPANGVVTLDPATGTFVYTPNVNYNGSDSFVVTISDGNGGTTTSLINVGINPVNDAPVSSNQNLTTPEDTSVTGQVVASDIDGDTLAYSVSGQPTNGSVTLNLATGSFVYTPNANYNGSDSFVVTISDGNGGTTTSLITIGVAPVNDAPVSSNLNLTTLEDTPVNGQVNATDVDGDTLSFNVSGNPANGSVVINAATGSFTYNPNANYNGGDSFVVTVSDGNGGTTTSTITIGVTPVNDAPVASNLNLTTDEDIPITRTISANDPDGDTLTYTTIGSPTNGTVVLNSATGTFTYTPNAGYSGSDSFVVSISDGNGGTTTSTVTIGINAVNQAPTAAADNATTDESTAVSIPVLANDTDLDGDSLTITNITQGANGSVVIDAVSGELIYNPNPGFTGTDSFTYTVDDGSGATSTATVTVTVNAVVPVNNAPVAVADSFTVNEGGTLQGVAVNVLANDTDADGDTLTAILVAGPSNGLLTLNADGQFKYVHNGSETTSDSFTYKVNDGTVDGNTVTVNITVTPVNDAPVARTDDIDVSKGGTATVLQSGATSVLANDSDAEGDALTAILVDGPSNGNLTLNADGTFSYTHDGSNARTDAFTYRANDGTVDGNLTNVIIRVSGVNDPTIVTPDTKTIAEDTASTTGNVLSNDTDADDILEVASFSINGTTYSANDTAVIPSVGSLTLLFNGHYLFQPLANYNGSVPTVTYTTNTGVSSTLNITVTPVNDAPVANDDSFTINMNTGLTIPEALLTGNDTDVDGDVLTVTGVSTPVNGMVSLVGGVVTFTPTPGFSGAASFTYTVQDPSGASSTAVAHITVINQPSVLVADTVTIDEESMVVGTVLGNDTDPDDTLLVVSFTINGTTYAANTTASIPSVGTLYLQADGGYLFTPVANYNGSVPTVIYTTNTGFSSTLDITVTPDNDAPVAVADSINVLAGGTVSVLVGGAASVLTNDSDVDADTLSAILVAGPSHGTLTLNADGTFSYAHDGSATTTDSFSYKVNDGTVDGNTVIVNISVASVNHVPFAVADSISVAEGGTATILVGGATSVLANDSDLDGNILNAILVTGPANGTLTLNANGTFSYIHDGSETTADSFTYKVNDGTLDGNTVTVSIGITPVNDAPVAVADSFTVAEGGTLNGTSVLANDTDAEGNPLTAILVSGPTNGTLTLNADGTFNYVHNGSETTSDSFTYKVNDGSVDGNTVTVTIGVTPVNDAPQTNAVTVSGNEDNTIAITLSGSDVDGTVTGFVIKSLPANGTLYSDATLTTVIALNELVNTSTVYFKPNADWNGSTSFNYAAQDDLGLVDATPAIVSITVNPVADTAIVGSGTGTVKEDTPAQSTAAGTLSITDPDAGEEGFQVQSNTSGTYGSFSITSTGEWTYSIDNSKADVQKLKEGETKTEIFTVKSIDGTTSSVVITVTGTNDGPVAVNDSATIVQDNTLTMTPDQLLANDTDIDGDALSISSVQGAVNGSVNLVGGNAVFTPTAGYCGPASFAYTVIDNKGGTATGTVNVTVSVLNQVPVAVNDPIGVAYSAKLGDASASDLWSSLDSKGLSVGVNGYNANGTSATLYLATIDGNANTLGVNGSPRTVTTKVPDQIEYDKTSGKSESLEIVMNGRATQATFSISRLIPGEDGGEVGMWSAYYQGALVQQSSFRLAGSDAGSFTINTSGLVFDSVKFTALDTVAAKGDGGDYFLTGFSASGSADVNTAYTMTEGATLNVASGSSLKLISNDTDAEGNSLVVTKINNANIVDGESISLTYGNLIIHSDGSFSYSASKASQLSSGQIATDSFTYTISDGHGGTATATATMTVIGRDLTGTAGNDILVGGAYSEQIVGGRGNDTMTGGLGADTFKWSLNEQGSKGSPTVDTITDFSTLDSDKLDLRDLLQNENSGNLTNYLHFSSDGINTTVSISSTGSFDGANYSAVTDQTIVLNNVNLTGGDTTIINLLKTNGNLITD